MLKKKKGVMIIKKQIGRHLVYYSQRVRGDDGNWCKYHINCTIYGCWWCTDNVTDIFCGAGRYSAGQQTWSIFHVCLHDAGACRSDDICTVQRCNCSPIFANDWFYFVFYYSSLCYLETGWKEAESANVHNCSTDWYGN